MKRNVVGLLFGLVSLIMYGCGDDSTPWWLYSSGGSSNVTVVSSVEGVPTQAVEAGRAVTVNAVVVSSGTIVPPGTQVTFTVPAVASAPAQSLTANTNTNGVAAVTISTTGFTANTNVTITASTTAYGSGTTQLKILPVESNSPASLAFNPVEPQTGLKATAKNLDVYLKTATGAPVANQAITFSANGGTLNPTTSVNTDANGKASVAFTSATAGSFTVTAKLDDVIKTQTVVNISDSATAPATMTLSATPPTQVKGTPSTITAVVVDQDNAPVNNVTVAFTTTGGTLSAATATTGADGKAIVTLTNAAIGSFVVSAKCPNSANVIGKSIPVQFINNPADPTTITVTASPTTVGTVGGTRTSTIKAHVLDGHDPKQAVSGATVTFTTTDGTLSAATATTDAVGDATVTLTGGAIAKAITVTASVPTQAVAEGKISNTATVTVSDVTSVALASDKTSIAGNNIDFCTLTATVTMPAGLSAQGITVNFTNTGTGTLSAAAATTDASGKASVTLTSNTIGIVKVKATANSIASPEVTINVIPKPTKTTLTVFTTGTLPTGTKIGAAEPLITSPAGLVIDMDPEVPGQPMITNIPAGSSASGSYNTTTRVSDVAVIRASGFSTGNVFTLTYVIPAAVAVPQKSDFTFVIKNLGDVSGAPIPGLSLDFSITNE
jgi:adhesin/invasin